jgi:hypothetical protein
MPKTGHTEEIIAALKQDEGGEKTADIRRNWPSARRRFTGGRSSMRVWVLESAGLLYNPSAEPAMFLEQEIRFRNISCYETS